jgi:predicted hydrocarbon binding protein
MTPKDSDKHIKGVHFVNVIEYVKWKRGVLGLNRLFDKLNQKRKPPLNQNSFVEKEWYSYDLYLEVLRTADEVSGTGDLSRCYEIGYRTIQNLGHLSYLARAPDIHELVKNARERWSAVYDFGNLAITEDEPNKIVVQYHGFPEAREKCEYFRGSLAGTLEICGLKGEVKETACNTKGSEYCEYTLTWK